MTTGETTRAPCRRCLNQTSHTVLARHCSQEDFEIPDWGPAQYERTFELLECAGCGTVLLREVSIFSETPNSPTVIYYPPPVTRPAPPWRGSLPEELRSLLNEVYSALYADSRCLAMMGTRTVLDMVLLQKVGDVGSFADKLKELERLGFIGTRNREFLTAAVEAGSAAAHRGFMPEITDLGHVLDVVENVLQAIYVLEDAAAELRRVTPPRRR
jgi:Domain of unknown function (DUF4145)